jgi:hypothetical protein
VRFWYGTPIEYNIDSDVTWATPVAHMRRIILHDVHKTSRLIATPSGYWDKIQGLVNYLKDQKYTRRRNLEGVIFQAGIVVSNIRQAYAKEHLK